MSNPAWDLTVAQVRGRTTRRFPRSRARSSRPALPSGSAAWQATLPWRQPTAVRSSGVGRHPPGAPRYRILRGRIRHGKAYLTLPYLTLPRSRSSFPTFLTSQGSHESLAEHYRLSWERGRRETSPYAPVMST
jgi:hypothetical protein